jgi:aminomethyltransferase
MLRTPLHSYHTDSKAQMVDFAGWEMPIRYAGIQEEHQQVRTCGGLFDVSHMGRVKMTGRHARKFLERSAPARSTTCSRASAATPSSATSRAA